MCLGNYEAAFYITLRPQQATRSLTVFALKAKISSVMFISKHHVMKRHHVVCLSLQAHTCGNYLPTLCNLYIRRPQDMLQSLC